MRMRSGVGLFCSRVNPFIFLNNKTSLAEGGDGDVFRCSRMRGVI